MELAIIVVSYNTREMTLACLESAITETKHTAYEIIVIDNDSSDGSAEAIAEKFPDIKLIASKENYGFALGNNVAIKGVDAEYILLLNPDTVVLDGAIDKLMAFSREYPDAGIWGGNTFFGDMSLNPLSCHRRMTLWNQVCRTLGLAALFKNSSIFASEHFGGWQHDTVRYVDIVSGCFLLIKQDTWKKLDGFGEKYFMYGEEADLCLRAMKMGIRPIVTPDAKIIHYGGASERTSAGKKIKLFAGKIDLIQDHWPSWQIPVGRTLVLVRVLTRVISYRILRFLAAGKKRAHYAAMLDTWREVLANRSQWQYGYSGRTENS